jgi:ATP-independent RNA helicase DbpA
MDHLARGHLPLQSLKTLVLDEADRMLDMGFLDSIAVVAKACPKERQTLLFSATYPPGIESIGNRFMRQPLRITVPAQVRASGAPGNSAALAGADSADGAATRGQEPTAIRQRWYQVPDSPGDSARLDAVAALLRHYRPASTLAFCNTKAQCRALAARLKNEGFSALALSGELEQRERDQVLVQFANGSCSVLVATDVAARGLDIAELAMVINVDVTQQPEIHIHRIGRTGRAGASGWAISLASLDEMGAVGRIEQLQKAESEWHPLAELLPASTAPLLPAMATLQITGGRKEKIRAGDVLGALTAEAAPGQPALTREQIGKINVNEFSTYVAVDRRIAPAALARLVDGKVKGKNVKVRLLEA